MATIKAIEVVRNFNDGSKEVIVEVTCNRCSGNGVFQHYKHVNNGRCYECEGTGVMEQTIKTNKNDEVRMVSRASEIKILKPVNDNEAMRNAMLRINEEHKNRRQEIIKQNIEHQKLMEEMDNCTDRFTWDD